MIFLILLHRNKEIKIVIISFVILMIILLLIKLHSHNDTSKILEEQQKNIFSTVDKNTSVNVKKYSVYGTHFNIEGTLDIVKISGININYVDFVARNLEGDEIGLSLDYNYSDNLLTFSTFDKLNESLNLESLSINNYYIFLKVTFSNSDIKYYSLNNSSEYQDITYYTITKNNSNNKIDIGFRKYNDISYLALDVTKATELPADVYDIAIDPGHGGLDKRR